MTNPRLLAAAAHSRVLRAVTLLRGASSDLRAAGLYDLRATVDEAAASLMETAHILVELRRRGSRDEPGSAA